MSAQNLERTGIPYLSAHADIVVFDCKPWLGRSSSAMHHESAHWNPVVTVSTAVDFERALIHFKPHFALDFVGLGPLTPTLQRMLSDAGTRFVVQKSGSLPHPSLLSRMFWALRMRFGIRRRKLQSGAHRANLSAPGPAPGIFKKLSASWSLRCSLKAPDLALLAGKASLNHFTRRARNILWVGSQDFHIYRKHLATMPLPVHPEPYIVFIDDNLAYASDWSLLGLPAPVTPEHYYPAMRRLFSLMEARWKMPVVIAAHPSSRHDERVQQGFGQHKLIHEHTVEVVRGAKIVVVHGSTAISFAILSNKPVLFLTSDELQQSSYGLHIMTMASELGTEPFNIDHDEELPIETLLAREARLYSRYTDRYLCRKGTSEGDPWQAFIHYINTITPSNTIRNSHSKE